MSEPRRFFLTTLGCPKNQVDSDKLVGTLRDDGMVATDDPEVDQIPNLLSEGQILLDLFGRLAADGRSRPGGTDFRRAFDFETILRTRE